MRSDAIKKGIATVVKFFDQKTAQELLTLDKGADLLLGEGL